MQLAYEEAGEGRPFVWGHGLTSSRRNEEERNLFDWSSLHDVARVVRYDGRGHGESPASPNEDDYRWDALARDQLALVDSLGIDRYVAGGASMGAATALHVAVRARERLDGLVLCIPPTAWATRRPQGFLYRRGADYIERKGVGAWMAANARLPRPPIFRDEPPPLPPSIDEAYVPTVLRGAAASDLPDKQVLRELGLPTLVLAWATDPGHPVSTARALHDLLGGELHVARTMSSVRKWPERVRAFLLSLP